MSIAVAEVLEGLPDPSHLHKIDVDDQVVIMVGARVVFCFPAADLGMRNLAIVTLTELKFSGVAVAAALGLSPVYVSRVRGWARDHGSAGLVRDRGRPTKLTAAQLRRARAWREEGLSDVQIGQRLGVADTTVARNLAARRPSDVPTDTDTLDLDLRPEPDRAPEPAADGPVADGPVADGPVADGPVADLPVADLPVADVPVVGSGPACRGSGWIGQGVFFSRYAGAMLFHAFSDRLDAGVVLSDALGTDAVGTDPVAAARLRPRFDDLALLAATSMTFGLGAATIEQVKHMTAAEAGPLCGLDRLPDLRTLRPRLAGLADRMDPLVLQRAFASAMLSADPCTSGVYFVDDHFVAYTGAKPVPKGWDTKHRTAQRGRADTWIIDAVGRAVVFTTGEPSGLTKTLPPALAELRRVIGPTAKIMLGFDRGGAYPSVFSSCRDAGADWITYRRAPLAPARGLPMTTLITRTDPRGRPTATTLTYADEPVDIGGYGTARQISLIEDGIVVLQVLTSDTTACPVGLLLTLRARWRIENAFKYAAEHYGIDALGDYLAEIETNTRPVDNPDRKTANTHVKTVKANLADAERALAQLLNDRTQTTTTLNRKLGPAHAKIDKANKALAAAEAAREAIPAKLPADQIDPDARRALLRTTRRALHMVLRLLAYNSEHWLATHLNAYLRDNDEYRAITRETILRGLAGTITYTPQTITVRLHPPDSPKIARALTLLLKEINTNPPHLPGDHRPITYTLTPRSA
jgi:hypothetical protein